MYKMLKNKELFSYSNLTAEASHNDISMCHFTFSQINAQSARVCAW